MPERRRPQGIDDSERLAQQTRPGSVHNLGSSGWPAITYEDVDWHADPASAQHSRRQRLRVRGPYRAAVVPQIAGTHPAVSGRVATLAEEATIDTVRFDRDLGDDTAPFAALLLRSESAASSQIENLTVGAKRIALAQLEDRSRITAALVASNISAMTAAIELAANLVSAIILAMHRALLHGSAPDIAGKYRMEAVWIG